jgi:hypothetical protein
VCCVQWSTEVMQGQLHNKVLVRVRAGASAPFIGIPPAGNKANIREAVRCIQCCTCSRPAGVQQSITATLCSSLTYSSCKHKTGQQAQRCQ